MEADLETKATREGTVMAALRSLREWDSLPQSKAATEFPISLKKVLVETTLRKSNTSAQIRKSLQRLRVVEMSLG